MASAQMMVVLLTVAGLLAQDSQEPVPAPGERPRVLCGRKLADTRMLYCLSTKGDQKRAEVPLLWRIYEDDEGDSNDLQWVDRRAPEQAQLLDARGKRMPGLVDECCFKPCYLSELLNYC